MSSLILKDTALGKGVFAATPFNPGETVIEFRGPILTTSQLPDPYDHVKDHYMQIGRDEFLGPSGGLDDLINHSCDPNTGLHFHPSIRLVALREIPAGQEITWDYATSMDQRMLKENERWSMICHCGSRHCRGVITDFFGIPDERQREYIRLGIVAPFLLSGFPTTPTP